MDRACARTNAPSQSYLNIEAAANALNGPEITSAVMQAAKIGEASLKAETAKLGTVTGNLAASIGIEHGKTNAGTVYAAVGYFGQGSQHAHLVEYGTAMRTRRSATVSSSWNTRGKWIGLGTYPANFVTRAANVGVMPAFHPMENAIKNAQAAMDSAVGEGMAAAGQKALEAAVA